MKTYEKPAVTIKGSSPEPVESGCCLRSCGGVPGPMQVGKRGNARAALIIGQAKKYQ